MIMLVKVGSVVCVGIETQDTYSLETSSIPWQSYAGLVRR